MFILKVNWKIPVLKNYGTIPWNEVENEENVGNIYRKSSFVLMWDLKDFIKYRRYSWLQIVFSVAYMICLVTNVFPFSFVLCKIVNNTIF